MKTNSSSHGHQVTFSKGRDCFVLTWFVDSKAAGAKLRTIGRRTRDANKEEAERFAKKHNIKLPV